MILISGLWALQAGPFPKPANPLVLMLVPELVTGDCCLHVSCRLAVITFALGGEAGERQGSTPHGKAHRIEFACKTKELTGAGLHPPSAVSTQCGQEAQAGCPLAA